MSTDNGSADHGATTNGHLVDDGKVRVAIVGVGNCANSFVQGVTYYQDADPAQQVPGLMHVDLGGYHVRDIEFVAAFDIDAQKVGKDLSDAIWSGQNDTIKFADVPELGVKVHRGMTHDGLGKYLKQKITKAQGPTDDVLHHPKHPYTQLLLSAVPDPRGELGLADARDIGEPPKVIDPKPGCRFRARCPLAIARCETETPLLRQLGDGRRVACHVAD